MRVTLRELTTENEQAVRALRTTPAQEELASTVACTLSEAERTPHENPWLRVIYADEQVVGLVMVAWNIVPEPPPTNGPYIIDAEHQRKGYGREAMRRAIELVRSDGAAELVTSCVEGEGDPLPFYERLGFVRRGDRDPEGEIILRLPL